MTSPTSTNAGSRACRGFPNAGVINPDYFAFEALQGVKPVIWDGTRISMPPSFAWGNLIANAPPNTPFPGYLNVNKTNDFAISLTKVTGRHTLKSGFYNTHSYKAQQRQGWAGTITFANDTSNPLDSGFGFSNAALAVFSSYTSSRSTSKGQFVYNKPKPTAGQLEVTNKRRSTTASVSASSRSYDQLRAASNFCPGSSRVGARPCSTAPGARRIPAPGVTGRPGFRARAAARSPHGRRDRHAVSESGNTTNGFPFGERESRTPPYPAKLKVAPRFGMA